MIRGVNIRPDTVLLKSSNSATVGPDVMPILNYGTNLLNTGIVAEPSRPLPVVKSLKDTKKISMSRAKRQARRAARKDKRSDRKEKRADKRQERKVKREARKLERQSKDKGSKLFLLKPFKKLMTRALKQIGVKNPPSNLTDLAKEFYLQIVKKNAFEEDSYFGLDSPMILGDDKEMFITRETLYSDSIDPITISVIVTSIIKFVKGQMDRKQMGEPMTPIQEKIAESGFKVEEEVSGMKDDEIDRTIGEMVSEYWWIGALVLVGLFFAFRK
jgi:hypothetical protein